MAYSLDDLKQLTIVQLDALESGIAAARAHVKAEAARELKAKLAALAAESGLTMQELLAAASGSVTKSGRAKAELAPKYKHPENEGTTWSGRGRQPEWFKAYIEAGKSADDLLI